MQTKTFKVSKKRAFTPKYISPNQLTLAGFETPFAQKLTSNNRWMKMVDAIRWDKIVGHYCSIIHFLNQTNRLASFTSLLFLWKIRLHLLHLYRCFPVCLPHLITSKLPHPQ